MTSTVPGDHFTAIIKILQTKVCMYVVLEEDEGGTSESRKAILADYEVHID